MVTNQYANNDNNNGNVKIDNITNKDDDNGNGTSSNSSSRSIHGSNSSLNNNHHTEQQLHIHDPDRPLEKKPSSYHHHDYHKQNRRESNKPQQQQRQQPSFFQAPLTRVNDFIRGFQRSFAGFFGTSRSDQQNRMDPASPLEFNYRVLPLLIGCIIPVSILINVPSITSPWVGIPVYNETTHDYNDDPAVVPIPHWLNSMIILALVMAIICNICVFARFLERHVWHSVILSLITATLQDVLCIGAVVPFCILYPPSKGYVYLEGFWTMIASMVFSLTATVLMSIDLHRTPQFRLQGSGVTHKQRILIAEAMLLCFYLAIGALIFIYLEHWTFLEALFFVMVTITTIGFGDRVPVTTGGRIFTIFYGAGGIVLLALAVNAIRYVILEDLHRRFAIRAKERKAKRDARRRERREQRARQEERRQRLQEALERIQQMESTTLSSNSPEETTKTHSHYFTHFPRHSNKQQGTHLRLLSVFSRNSDHGGIGNGNGNGNGNDSDGSEVKHAVWSESRSEDGMGHHPKQETVQRTGTDNLLKSLEEFRHSRNGVTTFDYQRALERFGSEDANDLELLRFATMEPSKFEPVKKRSIFMKLWPFKDNDDDQPVNMNPTAEEQREADKRQAYEESMQEYQRRLRFSAAMFLTFWLAGAVIFTCVEKWDFGSSTYFVFVAFSTIGYGDFVPRTMAGRAIFLAYCLVGVVALTSLASLISEVLSKSMRRHVVETQIRRTERIEALEEARDRGEGGPGSSDADLDLESGGGGGMMDSSVEDGGGAYHDQIEDLNNAISSQNEENGAPLTPKTCHGSLENLVKISKEFDLLLQKVLGLDYVDNESLPIDATTPLPPKTPGAIVEYLEKEEDEELVPSYLSPSISRDITSTSSIHRHSLRPHLNARRHSMDVRGGTFHGFASAPASDSSSAQIQIKAWPTNTSIHSNLEPDHLSLSPSPSFSVMNNSNQNNINNNGGSVHRHNKNGTITIRAIDWKHLIEYTKQFKVLTHACEEALERLGAWEVSERKLRQKRSQARKRQKQQLNERRRRLNELGAIRDNADDGIDDEEELEDLEEWDEEGSADDEDDEILDQKRAKITAALLGSRSPRHGRSRHQSRHTSRHQSQHTSRQQSRRTSDQDPVFGSGTGSMDPNFLQPPVQPIELPLHILARSPCLGGVGVISEPGSGRRSRSRSQSRERSPGHRSQQHHRRPHHEDDQDQEQRHKSSGHTSSKMTPHYHHHHHHHPGHASKSQHSHSHAHLSHDHKRSATPQGKAKHQHEEDNDSDGGNERDSEAATRTASRRRQSQLPPALKISDSDVVTAGAGSPLSSPSPMQQPTEPRIAFTAATPHPLDSSASSPGLGFGYGLGSGQGGSLRQTRSPLSHLFIPDPSSPPMSPPGSQPVSPR
ncbi:hypothetical protein BGZ83_011617 [Gryganskiella cystojenkinii]|nr:hypothetical protein BGZ83_011617 [Gryganskiella cystojenkinii]